MTACGRAQGCSQPTTQMSTTSEHRERGSLTCTVIRVLLYCTSNLWLLISSALVSSHEISDPRSRMEGMLRRPHGSQRTFWWPSPGFTRTAPLGTRCGFSKTIIFADARSPFLLCDDRFIVSLFQLSVSYYIPAFSCNVIS